MIGLIEIKCVKNGERVVYGSKRIKQDFAYIAEMLKYGTFPIDGMQQNYDAYLEDGIELNVLAICNRHEVAETELAYLAEYAGDPTLLNKQGIAHLDHVMVAQEWKQHIIDGKKKYSPVLKTFNTQIRKFVKQKGGK